MEINKIHLGDAYKLIKEVPDKSVDLIVTDPPYEFGTGGKATGIFRSRGVPDTYKQIHDNGIGKGIDLSILDEFVRVMKKINVYIWCNKEQLIDYLTFFVKGKKCNFEMLIWAKNNPTPFYGSHYLKDKEYCLYFWETGAKLDTRTFNESRTVFFSNVNRKDKELYDHPTIKPKEIIKTLIRNSCDGGLVFDPFVGSGTTCAAAKELGFDYLGFEIDERYHKIACDRLEGITQIERKAGAKQLKLFED